MRSAETCGLGELATQLNEGLLLVTEWNGFLGAQTGLLGGFGKISTSITITSIFFSFIITFGFFEKKKRNLLWLEGI